MLLQVFAVLVPNPFEGECVSHTYQSFGTSGASDLGLLGSTNEGEKGFQRTVSERVFLEVIFL
jgi:hypothetical protein